MSKLPAGAIIAALFLAVFNRATAGPSPDPRRGLNAADPGSFVHVAAYFPTNTGSVRFWVPWQWVQSSASETLGSNPHWSELDAAVDQAQAKGISVLVTLRAVSSWGTVKPTQGANLFTSAGSLPSDLLLPGGQPNPSSHWATFVRFLVARYSPMAPGSVAFEIENEPNASNFWSGSVGDYTALLAATDYWIKQVAPQATVLAGALACDKDQPQDLSAFDGWQTAILATKMANGGANPPLAYDALAVHDYYLPGHWNPPPFWRWSSDVVNKFTFLSYLQHIMDLTEKAHVTVPIWVTETGFPSNASPGGSSDETPLQLQADWLTNAFNQALASGVERIFWLFALDVPSAGSAFQSMGLSDVNGTPRPAFAAFSAPSAFVTLVNEQALFTGPALGSSQMPDQVTPFLLQPDGSYSLFVTGVWDSSIPDPSVFVPSGGVTSLFTATKLDEASTYATVERVYVNPIFPGPVPRPPSPHPTAYVRLSRPTLNKYPYPVLFSEDLPCKLPKGGQGGVLKNDNCAGYNGMVAVFPVNGKPDDLVGFYIADQGVFGNGSTLHGAFYGQLCLAISHDGGNEWKKRGPTLIGEPLPAAPLNGGPVGFNQPTVIRVGNDYYAYAGHFSNTRGYQGLKAARAPVNSDGSPGTWSWLTQDGSGALSWVAAPDATKAYPILLKGGGMLHVSLNTYLDSFLMILTEQDGWYYSTLPNSPTHLDAEDWSAPVRLFDIPPPGNWVHNAGSGVGYPTWENVALVTPGAADGQTGHTGFVIFSYMPEWGTPSDPPREFNIETFILNKDALP